MLFYCDRQKHNLTGGFFIFLFMVTGGEIIFICGAEKAIQFYGGTFPGLKITNRYMSYTLLYQTKFWNAFLFLVIHNIRLNQGQCTEKLRRVPCPVVVD